MKETDTDRPDPGKGAEEGEKSPEYLAFEAFAKRVLSVPKTEIDRREDEEKGDRPSSSGL